jgi:hypothetical protein
MRPDLRLSKRKSFRESEASGFADEWRRRFKVGSSLKQELIRTVSFQGSAAKAAEL